MKPKKLVRKEKEALTLKNAIILLNARQKVLNAFGICPKRKHGKKFTSILDCAARVAKVCNRKQLKVLTPEQILQILPTTLAQVKDLKTC